MLWNIKKRINVKKKTEKMASIKKVDILYVYNNRKISSLENFEDFF